MAKDIYPKTIKDFLDHISKYGSRQALVTYGSDDSLSYSVMIDRILLTAANLKNHKNLHIGDRIMLYGLSGPDWVVVFFACLLDGYVALPIDSRMSSELIEELIKKTNPKIIISKDRIKLKISADNVLVSQIVKDKVSALNIQDFETLGGDVLAEIILTSGTWSQPKGVTLTHKNLLSNLKGVDTAYKLADGAKLLSILPLSHAYEQMVGLMVPLYRGASIAYVNEIRADILTDAIKDGEITTIVAVPRILELLQKGVLKKVSQSNRHAFNKFVINARYLPISVRRKLFTKVHESLGPSLTTFTIGGAPLEQSLDHFFQGLGYTVLVGYGLSETSPVLSISLEQKRKAGSVGRPLANVNIELSTDGEVVARGDSVFHGYWPEKHKGKKFKTGDLGHFDDHGNIVLTGRSKNLVVFPSGDKIFLEDIERIADGFSGINESCAANIGDDNNPHIHLFVITTHQRLDHLREKINSKLPFGVNVRTVSRARIEALPRTHTLKLSRKQIIDCHYKDIEKVTARPS